jgi:hypothetical protein
VDAQGAGAAGGGGEVNEVFYSQPAAMEPVAVAAAQAVGHVVAGREKGPEGKLDSDRNETDKQDTREDEGVLKERKKKEREEIRRRREEQRIREEKAREEELLRIEDERKKLDSMRDQARKKATAGVKARLDGRYYAVCSIRATRSSGRELNRNRREEQPDTVGVGFQGEDERWIRNYNIHNIERAVNMSCSFNPRLAMCYTCFREPH